MSLASDLLDLSNLLYWPCQFMMVRTGMCMRESPYLRSGSIAFLTTASISVRSRVHLANDMF